MEVLVLQVSKKVEYVDFIETTRRLTQLLKDPDS